MKNIIILFFFSSISLSLFAQEGESNHHLFLKYDIGGGCSTWRSKTPVDNYKGNGPNLCINLTPEYNYKNLMVGLSYGYEQIWIDTLINTSHNFPYGSGFTNNSVSLSKFSLTLGYNLTHIKKISVIATVRVGTFRLDKSFDNDLIKNRWLVNPALNLNYNIGNRFSVFIQPNFEYKYYKLDKDQIGGQLINHRITSFNCLLGLNYKIL
jgi:hypothetical protein